VKSENAKLVGVVQVIEGQPWGAQLKEDLEAGVAEDPGDVTLEFADTHMDVDAQARALEAFLKKKVDALVLAPIGVESVKPLLRKFRVEQIPVLVVGDDLGDPDLYRSVIIPDNRQIGRKMGEFFVEASGGKADILEITGIAQAAATTLRSQGFREAIAGHPGIRVVDAIAGDWNHATARDGFSRWLGAHPRPDGVFAQNDEMARGVLDAAREAGCEDGLLVTGVDALKGQGLSMVMQGRLGATLMNPPPGRPTATNLLAVLAGEPCLERTVLQTSIFRSHEKIRAWQESRSKRV
jgi:ribose transport system substrate-binding protein